MPRSGEPARFYRTVVELRDRKALDDYSTFEIAFAPGHERLALHRLRVRRAGEWQDRAAASEQRFAERETRLADNILSGTRSLLLLIPDLRIGDVLEASWSVVGSNPAIAGELSTEFRLSPAGALRRRLDLWIEPGAFAAARVFGGGPAPVESETGGVRHLQWDVAPPATRDSEAGVPDDVAVEPSVQISSFRDWSEVTAWGDRQYRRGGPSPALDRIAEPWRKLGAADRLLAALRFVQAEIRYLALAEGEHSLRPESPDGVVARRYGDCKDKAVLLVDLLGRLGIEARPALVSSWRGDELREVLPSPGVFDHAVVTAVLDGERLWMDPTLAPQSLGGIGELWLPRYRWGLVLDAAGSSLTEIPDRFSAIPPRQVSTRYEVQSGLRQWKVEIETRYRGQGADDIRADLERDGRESLAGSYLDYYRDSVPELLGDPLEVKELAEGHGLVTVERYRREDGNPGFVTLPFEITGYLPVVDEPEKRIQPIALRYPFAHEETLDLRSPGTAFKPNTARLENRWFVFEAKATASEGRVEATYRLETKGDRVAAADAPLFAAEVAKVKDLVGYRISLHKPAPPRAGAAAVLLFALTLFTLAGRATRRRLRELSWGRS